MAKRQTENLNLNIDYASPDTLHSMRYGYDFNFTVVDDLFPFLIDALESTDDAFSESIDLEEGGN
jgi:hypothetical protein